MNINVSEENFIKFFDPKHDINAEKIIARKCIDKINNTTIAEYFKLYPKYMEHILNTEACINAHITSNKSLPYIYQALTGFNEKVHDFSDNEKSNVFKLISMIMAPAFSGKFCFLFELYADAIWDVLKDSLLLTEDDLVYATIFLSFPWTSILDVISSLMSEKEREDSIELILTTLTIFFKTCIKFETPVFTKYL